MDLGLTVEVSQFLKADILQFCNESESFLDFLPCKVISRCFLLPPTYFTHSLLFKFSDTYCSYTFLLPTPSISFEYYIWYHTISNLNVTSSTDTKFKFKRRQGRTMEGIYFQRHTERVCVVNIVISKSSVKFLLSGYRLGWIIYQATKQGGIAIFLAAKWTYNYIMWIWHCPFFFGGNFM